MLYTFTQAGFIILTIIFYYLLYHEFKIALPGTTLTPARQSKFLNTFLGISIGWAVVISTLSLTGITGRFDIFPFNIGPILLVPLIIIIVFTFSKTLAEVLRNIEPCKIIRLQVFRVFVEILLWMFFIQNILPVQMTFEGRNFDILAGLTAPVIGYLAYRNKLSTTVLIIWNLVCFGLLINIVAIAILSMPTPFRYFMNEPSNTIVTVFPIIWLPAFLVPLAYMLHFISLRQLTLKK